MWDKVGYVLLWGYECVFVGVYVLGCEGGGIREVVVEMGVYVIWWCKVWLELFGLELLMCEVWLIEGVEGKGGEVGRFVVWVLREFEVVESVWGGVMKGRVWWFEKCLVKMMYCVFWVVVVVFVGRYGKRVFEVLKGYMERVEVGSD